MTLKHYAIKVILTKDEYKQSIFEQCGSFHNDTTTLDRRRIEKEAKEVLKEFGEKVSLTPIEDLIGTYAVEKKELDGDRLLVTEMGALPKETKWETLLYELNARFENYLFIMQEIDAKVCGAYKGDVELWRTHGNLRWESKFDFQVVGEQTVWISSHTTDKMHFADIEIQAKAFNTYLNQGPVKVFSTDEEIACEFWKSKISNHPLSTDYNEKKTIQVITVQGTLMINEEFIDRDKVYRQIIDRGRWSPVEVLFETSYPENQSPFLDWLAKELYAFCMHTYPTHYNRNNWYINDIHEKGDRILFTAELR